MRRELFSDCVATEYLAYIPFLECDRLLIDDSICIVVLVVVVAAAIVGVLPVQRIQLEHIHT